MDLKNTTYEMVDLDDSMLEGDISVLRRVGDLIYISTEESKDLTVYPDGWVDGMPPEDAGDEAWDEVQYNFKYSSHIYTVKPDGSDLKKLFDVDYDGNNSMVQMTADEKQNIYALSSGYNDALEQTEYQMTIYDSAGKKQNDYSLTDFFDPNDNAYIQSICIGKDGLLYLNCDTFIVAVDDQAREVFRVKSENYIGNMIMDKDGEIVTSSYNEDGDVLRKIDSAKKAFGNPIKMETSIYTMLDGLGDYDFFDQTGSGIDGINYDGSRHAVLNWVGSNLNGQNVIRSVALPDGNFMVYYYDYNAEGVEGENGLKLLKKVAPDQVKDKVGIVYGGIWISDELKTEAIKFNKSQNKYQIVIRDYGNEEDPVSKLNADVLAGDIPDILDLSSLDSDKLIAKGMMTDLYPLMEQDSEIKKDDFIDSVIKAMEIDGKLYYITPRFSLNVLVGSKKDIGDRDHLSVKDVMELEQKYPDAKAFSTMTSNVSILSTFLQSNYDRFVDWNTGKCTFDSQEFIDILEYAATYPNEDDINYEESDDMVEDVRAHKLLFAELWNMSYLDKEMYDKLFDDQAAYIGYPSDQPGIGFSPTMMMGISAKSPNKEAAWQFVRTLLTKEAISKNTGDTIWYDGFPIRKDSLETELKRVSATKKYTDEFGVEIEPVSAEWGFSDTLTVRIKPMDEKGCDAIREILSRVDHRQAYNSEIDNIISEETGAFFSKQKSAKDVAGIIQNRVSTYVNENR